MSSDHDMEVKIAPQQWSKLQNMSKVSGKSTSALVEEALQAFFNQSLAAPARTNGECKRPQATYKPQTHLRQISVVPSEAAVLFIDVQNYNCHKEGAEVKDMPSVRRAMIAPIQSIGWSMHCKWFLWISTECVLFVVRAPTGSPCQP